MIPPDKETLYYFIGEATGSLLCSEKYSKRPVRGFVKKECNTSLADLGYPYRSSRESQKSEAILLAILLG